ncbi:MAG TPA: GAF domain-containing sensor histidine kinase [Anaerolineae bacterium]|nr:GAF domain-containing sensor histidine kinase [Anaerolineae bacterium]
MNNKPKLDAARLSRMVEISRALNSITNLDDLLSHIIKEAADLTQAEAASILLLDPRTHQLHFKASSNQIPSQMAEIMVSLDDSIAGAILQANKPMYIQDVTRDPRWNSQVGQVINFDTRQILGVPMRNVNQEPVGVLEALNKVDAPHFSVQDLETLAVLADIAGVAVEKARLFTKLEQANAALSELDEVKSNFIAIASHELRTPLAVIMGYVSFLREDADETAAEQFDTVLDAAVHLRGLIQDMANLSYVDAGQTTLLQQMVDLATLVREMELASDETAAAKNQTVALTLAPVPLEVIVDRSMIEVVLGNLFNNAVKFTPQNGRIAITVERQGREAWFRIQDTGSGIPEDQLERIFHRFYQIESSMVREHGGMGLGLSIAKELVELNHGRIWAESAGEDGSEFIVALPLAGGRG